MAPHNDVERPRDRAGRAHLERSAAINAAVLRRSNRASNAASWSSAKRGGRILVTVTGAGAGPHHRLPNVLCAIWPTGAASPSGDPQLVARCARGDCPEAADRLLADQTLGQRTFAPVSWSEPLLGGPDRGRNYQHAMMTTIPSFAATLLLSPSPGWAFNSPRLLHRLHRPLVELAPGSEDGWGVNIIRRATSFRRCSFTGRTTPRAGIPPRTSSNQPDHVHRRSLRHHGHLFGFAVDATLRKVAPWRSPSMRQHRVHELQWLASW
jgi:hypothetical protein